MLKKLLLLLTIGALAIVCAGCSNQKQDDVLVIGTSADNPPYEYLENGEVVGFDIEFIKEVAEKMGKKVEIRNMEFHSLLAALSANNIDLVVAGMSVTPERLARVDFSIPYTKATIAILYHKDDNFTNSQDLVKGKVGAQLGSTYSIIAHNLAIRCQCQVTSLPNNLVLVQELLTKKIKAVVIEQAQAEKFMATYPELRSFPLNELNFTFAVAMPKGSELKPKIDAIIQGMESDGTLKKLAKKWGV